MLGAREAVITCITTSPGFVATKSKAKTLALLRNALVGMNVVPVIVVGDTVE